MDKAKFEELREQARVETEMSIRCIMGNYHKAIEFIDSQYSTEIFSVSSEEAKLNEFVEALRHIEALSASDERNEAIEELMIDHYMEVVK